MSNKIKVRWEADDGYVGGSRPHMFTIDLDEMAQDCETEQEAEDYLNTEIQSEFENRVSWSCRNESEVMDAWRAHRQTIADSRVDDE